MSLHQINARPFLKKISKKFSFHDKAGTSPVKATSLLGHQLVQKSLDPLKLSIFKSRSISRAFKNDPSCCSRFAFDSCDLQHGHTHRSYRTDSNLMAPNVNYLQEEWIKRNMGQEEFEAGIAYMERTHVQERKAWKDTDGSILQMVKAQVDGAEPDPYDVMVTVKRDPDGTCELCHSECTCAAETHCRHISGVLLVNDLTQVPESITYEQGTIPKDLLAHNWFIDAPPSHYLKHSDFPSDKFLRISSYLHDVDKTAFGVGTVYGPYQVGETIDAACLDKCFGKSPKLTSNMDSKPPISIEDEVSMFIPALMDLEKQIIALEKSRPRHKARLAADKDSQHLSEDTILHAAEYCYRTSIQHFPCVATGHVTPRDYSYLEVGGNLFNVCEWKEDFLSQMKPFMHKYKCAHSDTGSDSMSSSALRCMPHNFKWVHNLGLEEDENPILNAIRTQMIHQLALPSDVILNPKSLNVYLPGAHFEPHKVASTSPNFLGQLIVTFDTPYSGGEVEFINSASPKWKADFNAVVEPTIERNEFSWKPQPDAPPGSLHWLAFYADTEHQINPIKFGARIGIMYEILLNENPLDLGSTGDFQALLPESSSSFQSLDSDPQTIVNYSLGFFDSTERKIATGRLLSLTRQFLDISAEDTRAIGFGTHHNYSYSNLHHSELKGCDAWMYKALQWAAEQNLFASPVRILLVPIVIQRSVNWTSSPPETRSDSNDEWRAVESTVTSVKLLDLASWESGERCLDRHSQLHQYFFGTTKPSDWNVPFILGENWGTVFFENENDFSHMFETKPDLFSNTLSTHVHSAIVVHRAEQIKRL